MAQSNYGTVRAFPNFDAEADCQALHTAMKGAGTDEDSIIQVLAHRSNAQRQQLRTSFKQRYGQVFIIFEFFRHKGKHLVLSKH